MGSLNVYALPRLIEDHEYIVHNLLCYSFGKLHVRSLDLFDELYRQYVVRQVWDDYIGSWYGHNPVPEIPQFPKMVPLTDPREPYGSMTNRSAEMEEFCSRLFYSVEENRDPIMGYNSLDFPENRKHFYISCTSHFIEMDIGQFYVLGGIVKLFVQNPIDKIGRRGPHWQYPTCWLADMYDNYM